MSFSKSLKFYGNWKMAQSLSSVRDFFANWNLRPSSTIEIAVFPSAIHLPEALKQNAGKALKLGAQDCSNEKEGAFTGEISAKMISEIGLTHVLIGHSERRQRGGETNQTLRAKLDRAFEATLTPVFCVGETLTDRDAGKVFDVLQKQMEIVQKETRSFVLAYEPVWAIGTGRVASLDDIQKAHEFLKKLVPQVSHILYGGSVKPDNAASILSVDAVGGLLVGGASLKAKDFQKIVESAMA